MSTPNTNNRYPAAAKTCEECGLRFAVGRKNDLGSAYYTHQNAYPPYHPLRRCCDPMEMQALGYKRRKRDGAYTADLTTDTHPSSARMLATFRQEREQYELTGDAAVQIRMIPLGWLEDSLAKPVRKRAATARRVRRYRERVVASKGRALAPPSGSAIGPAGAACNAMRGKAGIALHTPT